MDKTRNKYDWQRYKNDWQLKSELSSKSNPQKATKAAVVTSNFLPSKHDSLINQGEPSTPLGARGIIKTVNICTKTASNLSADYAFSDNKEDFLDHVVNKKLDSPCLTTNTFDCYRNKMPNKACLFTLNKFTDALNNILTQVQNNPNNMHNFIMQMPCLKSILALSIKIEDGVFSVSAYNPTVDPRNHYVAKINSNSSTQKSLQEDAQHILDYMLQNIKLEEQNNMIYSNATIYSTNTSETDDKTNFDITIICDPEYRNDLIIKSRYCGLNSSCFHDDIGKSLEAELEALYDKLYLNNKDNNIKQWLSIYLQENHSCMVKMITNKILQDENFDQQDRKNMFLNIHGLFRAFQTTNNSRAIISFAVSIIRSDMPNTSKGEILISCISESDHDTKGSALLLAIFVGGNENNIKANTNAKNYIQAIFDNSETGDDICSIMKSINKTIENSTLLRFASNNQNTNFANNLINLILTNKKLNDGQKFSLLVDIDNSRKDLTSALKSEEHLISALIDDKSYGIVAKYMNDILCNENLYLNFKVMLVDTKKLKFDKDHSLTELLQVLASDRLNASLENAKVILSNENLSDEEKISKLIRPSRLLSAFKQLF